MDQEAEIMRRLSHPRIIACYGIYELNGSYCMVMELAEGGSLQQLIKTQPELQSWIQKSEIALDIIQGMVYLHKLHIIHRDLKPGNIVLDAYMRAKITDFGLSVMKTASVTSVKGNEMGTVQYMVSFC